MMTSTILRGLLMSDGPPTEDRAVSSFLDYVALACIFGCVDEAIVGKWLIALVALAAAVMFHIVGIKWASIKLRFDSGLWGKRIASALRVMIVLTWITGAFAACRFSAVRSLRRPH